ncbi:MAG: hydrogenase maturation factor [Lachnospiraceae bacterium]|nr:hydrogenase maturation factor [Lachnospiraceae bacterium]
MRRGKISESVLKRSVLKKIKTHRDEVVCGAGIGTDCAILSFGEGFQTVLATTPVTSPAAQLGSYAVPMALNNVVLAGAEPVGIMLTILLPEETEETELQELMEGAEAACSEYGVQIVGGHTEVTSVVKEPVMTVTGVGRRDAAVSLKGTGPGQDVVISKWIGLEGTVRLARQRRQELCTRYPERMVEEAAAFDRYLSIIPEAATAMKSGVCGMHDVSRGGIFGALWELAESAGVGLEIELKKIPVKQETIEICEFFGLNPYELLSGGCLIMTAENGEALVTALARENIPAVVAGRTTDGNDRVLYNEDEKRYLDRPQMDQIYCVFSAGHEAGFEDTL